MLLLPKLADSCQVGLQARASPAYQSHYQHSKASTNSCRALHLLSKACTSSSNKVQTSQSEKHRHKQKYQQYCPGSWVMTSADSVQTLCMHTSHSEPRVRWGSRVSAARLRLPDLRGRQEAATSQRIIFS